MKYDFVPEYKRLSQEYREYRNKARRLLTKVKSMEKELYFLDRIVQPRKDTDTKLNDVELEYAVMYLFENLNFKCNKPESEEDVDVKVKFKDYYFGIEVKNGNMVSANDTVQPFRHKMELNETFHPILLYNNAKTNDNWESKRISAAINLGYGLLLTTELRKGYSKLKNNKITFDQFLSQLNQNGEIKFSNKALDRANKSEAPR